MIQKITMNVLTAVKTSNLRYSLDSENNAEMNAAWACFALLLNKVSNLGYNVLGYATV
jgi:hypothetical protein